MVNGPRLVYDEDRKEAIAVKRVLRFCLKWILLPAVLLALIPTGMLIYNGYTLYRQALAEKPVAEMAAEIQTIPNYTPVDELPQIYLDAVISVEDKRFYSHPGVDPLAIARAAFNDLRTLSFAEGGSTITQQLAKNEYFTQEKTLTRKIAEAFMALKIERELDKDTILGLYLNSINFGSGYYCVADASEGYFGKSPSMMNDWAATLLAGIPNAPSVYSPDADPELALQRQRQVLQRMVACGKLSRDEAAEILSPAEQGDRIYLTKLSLTAEGSIFYVLA